MNADGRSTSQQLYVPTLLVIDGCEDLVDRCLDAADSSGLSLKTCSSRDAAVAIPRRRPLAIVVPNGIFDRVPHDLEALARGVRSALFQVDPDVSVRELEAMFAAAIAGCSTPRERSGSSGGAGPGLSPSPSPSPSPSAGRYSITDTLAEEAPFSRSTPPPSSRAPHSVRQTLPRVPGLASTRPAPSSAPPASGTQATQTADRPSYAAIRAVFSGR